MTGPPVATPTGGVTSAGLPYPGPQDPVADTGKFIRDLDAAVTYRLANAGFISGSYPVTTNGSGDVTVQFPALATVRGAVFQYRANVADVWVIYPIVLAVAGTGVTVRLIAVDRGTGYSTRPFVGSTTLTAMAWGVPK